MTRYAENTSVGSDRSRAEIERTLQRYGATAFGYGWEAGQAQVMFHIANRRVRFRITLPDSESPEIKFTPARRYERSKEQQEEALEQAVRQRWRALALVIKAKLEAVEAGISTVEEEFLAHIMLPDGSTVGEWAEPQLKEIYQAGGMPALLPGSGQ
jgi:hypothetical protein